jgi:hypothetical protein
MSKKFKHQDFPKSAQNFWAEMKKNKIQTLYFSKAAYNFQNCLKCFQSILEIFSPKSFQALRFVKFLIFDQKWKIWTYISGHKFIVSIKIFKLVKCFQASSKTYLRNFLECPKYLGNMKIFPSYLIFLHT